MLITYYNYLSVLLEETELVLKMKKKGGTKNFGIQKSTHSASIMLDQHFIPQSYEYELRELKFQSYHPCVQL